MIKRIDNPFWNTHFPPLGWGCRCEVVQLPGKNHKETPDGSFQKPDVPPQFRENFGKKQKLFSDKHPYYQNKCQGCTKTAKLANENNAQCQACLNAMEQCKEEIKAQKTKYDENLKKYNELKDDPDYTMVEFNPETGGVKATHKDRKKHKKEKTPLGLTPTQLEDACQNEVFKMGGSFIIQNEKSKRPNGEFASALDAVINGEMMDIRSICTDHTNVLNSITDKHKQLLSFNKDRGLQANALCLYYHEPNWYDENKIKLAIESYLKICNSKGEQSIIKKIIVVLRDREELIEVHI